jgi:hypothetical protein
MDVLVPKLSFVRRSSGRAWSLHRAENSGSDRHNIYCQTIVLPFRIALRSTHFMMRVQTQPFRRRGRETGIHLLRHSVYAISKELLG